MEQQKKYKYTPSTLDHLQVPPSTLKIRNYINHPYYKKVWSGIYVNEKGQKILNVEGWKCKGLISDF